MRASDVRLSELVTAEECDGAVLSIESDMRNYEGGAARWNSGLECHLLTGARRKVAALKARAERIAMRDPEYRWESADDFAGTLGEFIEAEKRGEV